MTRKDLSPDATHVWDQPLRNLLFRCYHHVIRTSQPAKLVEKIDMECTRVHLNVKMHSPLSKEIVFAMMLAIALEDPNCRPTLYCELAKNKLGDQAIVYHFTMSLIMKALRKQLWGTVSTLLKTNKGTDDGYDYNLLTGYSYHYMFTFRRTEHGHAVASECLLTLVKTLVFRSQSIGFYIFLVDLFGVLAKDPRWTLQWSEERISIITSFDSLFGNYPNTWVKNRNGVGDVGQFLSEDTCAYQNSPEWFVAQLAASTMGPERWDSIRHHKTLVEVYGPTYTLSFVTADGGKKICIGNFAVWALCCLDDPNMDQLGLSRALWRRLPSILSQYNVSDECRERIQERIRRETRPFSHMDYLKLSDLEELGFGPEKLERLRVQRTGLDPEFAKKSAQRFKMVWLANHRIQLQCREFSGLSCDEIDYVLGFID